MKGFNKEEYNKMCAEFLNLKLDTETWTEPSYEFRDIDWFLKELVFHLDWNWIMEVVEKIYSVINPSDSRKHDLIQRVGRVDKEAVVQALWEFLNWYNEQNSK
jgi:hypothetical protein